MPGMGNSAQQRNGRRPVDQMPVTDRTAIENCFCSPIVPFGFLLGFVLQAACNAAPPLVSPSEHHIIGTDEVASPASRATQPQTHHYVFAHYMVCFAAYGETVESYEREIKEAQAA